MSVAPSGLALAIRQAEESETFDLGGQNVTTITNTIQSAFAEPFPLTEMIRITFVTGAGKQARQKYDESAARAVTSTLRELGYEEDRGASAVLECAGTFKLQHDTGKNLKTVVVFPKIRAAGGGKTGNGVTGGGAEATPSLVPEGCPAHKIAMSTVSTFERMLHSQCPSWSQKKGCFASLEHLKIMIDDLDAKLMRGTPLDEVEQDFYDHVTGLDDKLAYVKEEMHKQIEEHGTITTFEKEMLLNQNAERLDTLATEMKEAEGQKLEKLKAAKAKAVQRKELLQDLKPMPPHKLRHEQAIARLWKEAVPLMQLEEKTKGRLLSVKEATSMARKCDIMQEIEELEEASRGWFEDDDAFDARVKAIRANFMSKRTKAKKATSYAAAVGGGGNGVSITGNATTSVIKDKWLTPGSDNKKNAWGSAASNKKNKKNKSSDVFAAMMEKDFDSDEDDQAEIGTGNHENDSDEDEKEMSAGTRRGSSSVMSSGDSMNNNHSSSGKKNSHKKKNKKNKGNKKKEDDMTEDELLASRVAANVAAAKAEGEQQVSHPAIAFLRNYLIPFVLSFIAWVVSLFFGKPKQKKR